MTMYDPNRGYGGGGGSYGPRRIRLEAIGEAWQILTPQLGTWVGLIVIYGVIMFAIVAVLEAVIFGTVGIASLSNMRSSSPSPAAVGGLVFGFSILEIVALVAGAFFQAGLMRAALKQVRGEVVSIGDLFGAGDVAGKLILLMLLLGVASFVVSFVVNLPLTLMHLAPVGMLLSMVASVFLGACMLIAIPAVVDRRATPIEALLLSWNIVKDNFGQALLLMLVMWLLLAVSAIPCGLGMLITGPLAFITVAKVYMDTVGGFDGSTPSIDMPLPPQDGPPIMGGFGR